MGTKGVAFEVGFEEEGCQSGPVKRIPPRFLSKRSKPPRSKEELHQKQVDAEIRRKVISEEQMQRIQQVQEQCLKINQSVTKLQEQDALRRGEVQVKRMTDKQIRAEVMNVRKGMDSMLLGLHNDISICHGSEPL